MGMYHDSSGLGPNLFKELLRKGLEEDAWQWDWTTRGTLLRTKASSVRPIQARIIAKSDGVWAGEALSEALEALSAELGGAIRVKSKVEDGESLKAGSPVCEWSGPARLVLALERPYLNLVSYSSGIATATRALVDEVRMAAKAQGMGESSKPLPRVTSTRKTLPGYRDLAIYGVLSGGGYSHRVSLSGGVLIKENHIAAAGGILQAVKGARETAPHGLKIEIEVRSLEELKRALSARVDGVLLDNFTPDQVKKALDRISAAKHQVFVEVSGGLSRENIADYVIPGVDVLSSGSITHSVRAVDLSLLVQ